MGESVRRKDHGGKRSAGGMEADCTISWSIRAVDTGIQGPAFRGKPYLLPKAAARQKNRLRLVRRSQAVVQEPVRAVGPAARVGGLSRPASVAGGGWGPGLSYLAGGWA